MAIMSGRTLGRRCHAGEDDLRWALAGAEYLLRVNATTPQQRRNVESLRQRLTDRIRRSEARA